MNDKGKANVVRKSALKLALLFTFVGMMMILIPMLTEIAEARTQGKAVLGPLITISNLKYQLDQGKWSVIPHIIGPTESPIILWETKGTGFFGGPERGSVEVDIKFRNNLAHAKFSWYNPDSGQNTCNVQLSGSHAAYFGGICTIPPHGTFVDAFYLITPDY
jgi:hypothetical protein